MVFHLSINKSNIYINVGKETETETGKKRELQLKAHSNPDWIKFPLYFSIKL